MARNIDREKEVKLLHLDSTQKSFLEDITEKFINKQNISSKESVEAFTSYVINLVEGAASGSKSFCDDLGNLSNDANSHIQKFTDAIFLFSKHKINYYKILNTSDIKDLVAKAASPRNRYTMQNISELEYKLKIISFSLLDTGDDDLENYMESTEDRYITSLTAINPIMMKNAFIEHIVDMIAQNDNHTISDIVNLAEKYSKYLGTGILTEEVVEELMQKYNDIERQRDSGLVHSARIEVFKLLEGAEK